MIRVYVDTAEIKKLADPQLMAQAEAAIVERGVDIMTPLARASAPSRSGRGRRSILGSTERRGSKLVGMIHAGKAFWLSILATGSRPHEIAPFRFGLTRRGRLSSRGRRASRALGPGRARGAISVLRFSLGGSSWLFRSRVRHPGLRADPWLEDTARAGEGAYLEAAEQILERALEGHRV